MEDLMLKLAYICSFLGILLIILFQDPLEFNFQESTTFLKINVLEVSNFETVTIFSGIPLSVMEIVYFNQINQSILDSDCIYAEGELEGFKMIADKISLC